MERPTALATGEIYHVFNRGAHKLPIFHDEWDYRRFQILLLLANSTERVDVGNLLTKYQGPSLVNLFDQESPIERLVDILAYSLLPNHFHIVLRQKLDTGVTAFMRKLATGYSMYFNLKHNHSGTLFQGRFKSSHIDSDPYFNWIFAYVHLNPVSVTEPEWKEKGLNDTLRTKDFLGSYAFSSYYDYYIGARAERSILAADEAAQYVESNSSFHALLESYQGGREMFQLTDNLV